VQSVGLEVRYPGDLDAALEGLRRLGLSAGHGSSEDCALRKVKDMVWFTDFSGNRIELVVRPLNSPWRHFPPGCGNSRPGRCHRALDKFHYLSGGRIS
jgi:2,3-dihydroxy-p-cumate/2,3-dihydroxybenzoate 3,4-dioxygenase